MTFCLNGMYAIKGWRKTPLNTFPFSRFSTRRWKVYARQWNGSQQQRIRCLPLIRKRSGPNETLQEKRLPARLHRDLIKRENLKDANTGKEKYTTTHAKRKRGIARRTVAKYVVALKSYDRRESGVAGEVGFAEEKHTSQHIMAGRLAVCVGRRNGWARVNDSPRAVVSQR